MSRFITHGEPGLLDAVFETLDTAALDSPLLRVGRLIEWNLFEPELHRAVLVPAQGPGGRPRFAPLLMFQVLMLARPDDRMESVIDSNVGETARFYRVITPRRP